ncbi:MAG: GumC family protein [Acidobacteriota bacterium]
MQQEEIGLQHYFEILWRRKWPIGVVFTIMMTLSIIGILVTDTTYTVYSKVAIKNQMMYYRTSMLSFAPGTDAPATTLSGPTYEEIINGLPFAQRVSRQLLAEAIPLTALQVRSALRAEYQEPDLIRIHASSKDPDQAVALANVAADVFVEDTKTIMRDELMQGRESILASLEKSRQEAQSLEDQIADFRRSMGFIDIESEMAGLRDKIAAFERSRGEVITQLKVAEAHRAELLNLAKVGASGKLHLDDPGIEEYRKLQEAVAKARIKYTANHPTVRNLTVQIASIEGRLRTAIARSGSNLSPEAFLTLKEELAETEANIANLTTAIDSWTAQIEQVDERFKGYPDKQAKLDVLEAKLASARERFKIWQDRLGEIDFKASKVPANAELVDKALAPRPAMGKGTAAALALIVSLMVGLGVGLLVEFADTALRSPEEITGTIGLGYLGSVVRLKDPRQAVFTEGKPVHQVAETYTRVYSNIKFAEVENPFRSVLVTSARKGEGKSTILVHLATAVAAAGNRVIVVDTDMRNPSVQRLLGTKHHDGLTSVLAGNRKLDEVLRETPHPGLMVVPSGPIPPNPAELLHSQAMKDIIAALESRADIVFFDSPPALLVADAMLLGGELDAAIIVAESGGISRKAVLQVKETLQTAKARILGVILNKVEESAGSYYNYYSYYKSYREPEEEQPHHKVAWFKGARTRTGQRSS